MFKLVVLYAFLAVAVAEPSHFYQPLADSSTIVSPAVTSISKSASSIVHPSPAFYYGTPSVYSHFIKKRGAPFYFPTTYAAGSPLLASTYSTSFLASAPLVSNSPLLAAPYAAAPLGYATTAHLIKKSKKRSAPVIPFNAINAFSPLTTYTTSLISSTPLASAAPLFSTPVLSQGPLAFSHLIKKRFAPIFASSYIAPAAITHQSRIDVLRSPVVSHYTAPLTYPSPYAYTQGY